MVLCQLLVIFCPHLHPVSVCCPHVVLFMLLVSEPCLSCISVYISLKLHSKIALPEPKEMRHFFPERAVWLHALLF